MQNWFPLGIAKGKAFCNRLEERKHLKHNILQKTHTLIISPRRYGKTSLAQQIISELKYPFCIMEFTLASDPFTAQNIFHAAIGNLITLLMPTHKKAFQLAVKYFSKLNPKLIMDTQLGATIELQPKFESLQLGITELLQNVDKAAGEAKKQVILFMDEFQQIATLQEHAVIEAAIRNAAQRLENASIIFSGSNRHLLQSIFDDKARPLYHLCDRINLERIQKEHYIPYIQKAAIDCWGQELKTEIIEVILNLTCCHPYYVNVLCTRVWRDSYPTNLKKLIEQWDSYVKEEQFRVANEMAQLSQHQKLMLMLLAIKPFKQPTSKEVINTMRASVGSVAKTHKILLQNDYIYPLANGYYKILDPVLESYLKREARIVLKAHV